MWLQNWVEFFFPKERVINEDIHLENNENSINQLKNNIGKLKVAKKMLNLLDIQRYNILFKDCVILDVQTTNNDIEYLILSPHFDKIKDKEMPPFYYPDINSDFTEIKWKKV